MMSWDENREAEETSVGHGRVDFFFRETKDRKAAWGKKIWKWINRYLGQFEVATVTSQPLIQCPQKTDADTKRPQLRIGRGCRECALTLGIGVPGTHAGSS